MQIIDMILHIDQYLAQWSQFFGVWLYVIIFAIIFAETGLVITPFLPGDSLLFALGAMTTLETGSLSLPILSGIILLAAFLGDNVNYHFGKYMGPKVFSQRDSKIFNPKHLEKTHAFYEKHGPKAVIIARFMPIVRTFVPFVAGVGQMPYPKFIGYSLAGSVMWSQIFLWAGNIFGNMPAIKRNFHIVIFAVIILSVMPIVIGWIRSKKSSKATA